MYNFINDDGKSLLDIACENRGLTQNIIKLFVDSGYFDNNLKLKAFDKIKNRKVKLIFENVRG